jgi:hypothetical protein
MSDMNVRSDSVDVEQIMKQIRARVREKRGVDYTDAEIQQLATVKLERFLDPRGVRSDLVEQYRRNRVVSPAPPNYAFEETTLFDTHRGLLRALRSLLKPLLKLFFNPDKITSALHIQAAVNTQAETRLRRLEEREPLSYELLHNLTVEVTRLGIEVQNLRMRLESVSSRLDFDERRARSLETVVQYRPNAGVKPAGDAAPSGVAPAAPAAPENGARPTEGGATSEAGDRRRRRRRRRRRPGQTMAEGQGGGGWTVDRADEAGGTADSDGDQEGGDLEPSGTADSDDQ